jgi:hypothetical protein
MLTYANMNMKRMWQGYGVRSRIRLVLDIMKEMKGSYFYSYPFGDLIQESFQGGFYVYIE